MSTFECTQRSALFVLACLVSGPGTALGQTAPARADRVEALLARMTLEEKVGQMTQVTLVAVAAAEQDVDGHVRLDPARLRQAVVEHHVGSILNVVNASLTLEGWRALLEEIQDVALNGTRLGIPIVYGIDFVHGGNYLRTGTIFPHNIGLAATFNRELVRRSGMVTAEDALAAGTPWNFAPVMDVGRIQLWPRYYETFGEDPFLAAVLGREATEGLQQTGPVAATLKHYLGYSASEVGRDRTPANLTERVVREYHLPPFRAGVEAGAMSVMVSSGEIDGVPVHASRYWLTDVLRGELGFDGVIVTDWQDVIFLHTRHRVAPTIKDAVRIAVEAGIDMSMTPYEYSFATYLAELVREGVIPEARVDESVRRILSMKHDLGLLDSTLPDPAWRDRSGTAAARSAARQAARESITLLANDGVLPLDRNARILVTGPAADALSPLHGGWTHTWQGTDPGYFPGDAPTLLGAIRARGSRITFAPGAGFEQPADIQAAVRAARQADVAIIAIGEDAYAEWVGDVEDLTLPAAQLELVRAVQATGTPTVLLLVQGRPRVISAVADAAGAIVMAYQPGMEGAEAIAEVLFGEHNPAGRLPFTYPRHPNALDTYDHRFTQTLGAAVDRTPTGFNPQFEFGHGLSYTTFAYSDLRVESQTMDPGGTQAVEVRVTNTGTRAGQHSVLLFLRQHYASLSPAVRRLRGFEKIELAPGASRTIRFVLSSDDLGFVGTDGSTLLEPGLFSVMVGDLEAVFELVQEARAPEAVETVEIEPRQVLDGRGGQVLEQGTPPRPLAAVDLGA
jgi:beta-glucosidase